MDVENQSEITGGKELKKSSVFDPKKSSVVKNNKISV